MIHPNIANLIKHNYLKPFKFYHLYYSKYSSIKIYLNIFLNDIRIFFEIHIELFNDFYIKKSTTKISNKNLNRTQ